MNPWFLTEGDVIPFTKKDDKVVKLPNVGAYPNFLTGVDDLQSRVKQGTLSNEMYKKLYTELLHRFMRRESAETPWFLQEFNDMPAGEYEGYELRVRKTGIKPPFVATAEIRKGYEIKGGGQTKEEAIDDVQKKIDDMKSTVATASGTTSLLFNAPFAHEMLKDPSTMDADLYMKIDVVDGKKVLVVGNNSEYTPEQLKAAGFSLSYDRRKQDKRLAGETTAMPMVNVSADTLNAMRLDANGIYQVNTDSPEKDDVGNTVYALQYLGRTSHGTKVRQPRPQFTIGTKTKMESAGTPWFLREDQTKLDYINKVLSSQPDIMDRIFKQLRIIDKKNVAKGYKQAGDEFDPRQYLDPKLTAPEDDYDSKGYREILIKALTQASGTMEEVESFLKNYGKVSYINVDLLKTENKPVPTTQFLKEAPGVSKGFVESMYNYLFQLKPDRGPGEIALAFLSPQIEIVGKGDLRIGGVLTEVKGQVGKKGGRFKDKTTSFGMPNLKFIEKEVDLPPELRIAEVGPFTGSARQISGGGKINVFTHAQKLEKAKPGLGQKFIQQMIAGTYISAPQEAQEIVKNFQTITPEQGKDLLVKISFANYKNELAKKGFNHFILLSPSKSLFFNVANINEVQQFVSYSAPEWKDIRNGAAAQISLL
jgi:hypothetical protein